MQINLSDITLGFPGLTVSSGIHLYEGCVVTLSRHKHNHTGTKFAIYGDQEIEYTLQWKNIFSDQLDRTWKDQFYATEHGAACLVILLMLKLKNYTVFERSRRKNGFDYWLGEDNDILLRKKARLEVSGIFQGTQKISTRYNQKVKQTDVSDNLNMPAFIGIVEFATPIAKLAKK